MGVVILTGGPGAGKSTVASAVAPLRGRGAVIEVDDVRQMLRHPHAAPWDGAEGVRQQRLGVINACGLARTFAADGCDVLVADVLTDGTAAMYRQELRDLRPWIVHLAVRVNTAMVRAERRHYHLTAPQFQALHAAQVDFRSFDSELDTDVLTVDDLSREVNRLLDAL